jgi:hypothetical protein
MFLATRLNGLLPYDKNVGLMRRGATNCTGWSTVRNDSERRYLVSYILNG